MTPLRWTYAALALAGTVVPLGLHGRWLAENNWAFGKLPAAWTANDAAAGAAWDLTISAVALAVWIVAECAARKKWAGLWAIPATCLIGVSCGLPLYLLLREPAGAKQQAENVRGAA